MDSMLPKKGMSYGELIVDNILGLDNDYESFGEKLGKAVDEDELGFLKNAAVGVYEGAKEFITNPVETTKEVVTNIKDSVQRLGTEDLDTRLKSMYGVDYTQATDEQVNAAREAVIGDALTAMELIPAAKVTVSAAKAGSAAIPSGVKADVVGQTKALLSGDTEFLKGTPTERSGTVGVGAEVVGQDDVSLDDITDYMDSEIEPSKPKAELTKPKKDVAPLVRPNEKRTAVAKAMDINEAAAINQRSVSPEEIKKIKDMNLTKLESSDFYSPILPFIKNIAIGSKGIKGSNVKKLLEKRANVNKTQLYWSGLLNEIDSDTIYDKDTLVNLARQNIPKIEIITNTGSTNARYKDLQRIPLVEDNSKDKFVAKQSLPIPGHIRFQGQPGAQKDYYKELIAINKNPKGNFYQAAESHWGYGGTAIAHTRLSEYTHNGNKFAVVEELQSDMAQVATDDRNKNLEVATKENSTNEIPLIADDIFNSLTNSSSELVSNFYITEAPSNFKFTNRFEKELEGMSQTFYNKSFNDLASEQEFVEVSETVLSDLMFQFANLKFKYENNEIGMDEVVQKITTNMPGITEKVLLRKTYDNLVSTPIDKIFSNAFSDYVFGKSTVKNNPNLKNKIADLFDTAPSISDFKKANLSMLKQSEATRVSLLMAIKDAKGNNINKIYVVPPKTAAYYHDFSKDTADKIYNSTLNKVLRVLNNETNNAIKYKRKNPEGIRFPISKPIGRAGSWEFDNSQVAMEIDITDFDLPDNPQFRFAEGGVVKDMDNQMKMAFMNEGGLKDDGMKRDPVSGNEVPNGSMASEVRDDIPAQLSEGEYVVPADVVRFFGVKFFEDLRSKAKRGLQSMEDNGRIGGEPVPMETGELSDEEFAKLLQQELGGTLTTQSAEPIKAAEGKYVSGQAPSFNPDDYFLGFSGTPKYTPPAAVGTEPVVETEASCAAKGMVLGPAGVCIVAPQAKNNNDNDGPIVPAPAAGEGQGLGGAWYGEDEQKMLNDPEAYIKEQLARGQMLDSGLAKAGTMLLPGGLGLVLGGVNLYNDTKGIANARTALMVAKARGTLSAEKIESLENAIGKDVQGNFIVDKDGQGIGVGTGINQYKDYLKELGFTNTDEIASGKNKEFLEATNSRAAGFVTEAKSRETGFVSKALQNSEKRKAMLDQINKRSKEKQAEIAARPSSGSDNDDRQSAADAMRDRQDRMARAEGQSGGFQGSATGSAVYAGGNRAEGGLMLKKKRKKK